MTDTLYRLRGLEWEKVCDNEYGVQYRAETIVGAFDVWSCGALWSASHHKDLQEETVAEWFVEQLTSLSAAQSAAEAHYRARMAEGLVPVKVLGTLPMTADGCVIGTGADLFYWYESQFDADAGGWVNHAVTGGVVSAPHLCYSTRSAAEAAKKEGER